jgi:hypothetical protein
MADVTAHGWGAGMAADVQPDMYPIAKQNAGAGHEERHA